MYENYCKEYFAGFCGGNGFNNFFPEILKGCERVYILKGSPGSGKSSIMKKIAVEAEKRSMTCERVYCSSDPDSLDGVIIREKSIAVIDGTAPHCEDPRYPGVIERIVNLGEYWNGEALRKWKPDIISLCDKKSASFSESYKYLQAKSELRTSSAELVSGCILKSKLQKAAERLFEREAKQSTKSDFTVLVRVCAAPGASGVSVKRTFSEAKTVYRIKNIHDTASLFLWEIMLLARKAEASIIISPDAYDRKLLGAVMLPESSVLFIKDEYCLNENAKDINMARFIDKELLSKVRVKERFLRRCESELTKGAAICFGKAMDCHAVLESLYIPTMNFDGINKMTSRIIDELFV